MFLRLSAKLQPGLYSVCTRENEVKRVMKSSVIIIHQVNHRAFEECSGNTNMFE